MQNYLVVTSDHDSNKTCVDSNWHWETRTPAFNLVSMDTILYECAQHFFRPAHLGCLVLLWKSYLKSRCIARWPQRIHCRCIARWPQRVHIARWPQRVHCRCIARWPQRIHCRCIARWPQRVHIARWPQRVHCFLHLLVFIHSCE